MLRNIYVDNEKFDSQMTKLFSLISEIPEFDDAMSFSSQGTLESQKKYIELAGKMKKLMTSYKQLMDNSVLKAQMAAGGYSFADESMTQQLKSTYSDEVSNINIGEV